MGLKMKYKDILKVDLDLKTKFVMVKRLKKQLYFLDKSKILSPKTIIKIETLYKNAYSLRIYLNIELPPKDKIIIQAILGDDIKRVAVNYRDYMFNIKDWNRLFTTKKYINGDIKKAVIKDITNLILK